MTPVTRTAAAPGRRRTTGFAVAFRLDPALTESARGALLARFVVEAIEARGLAYGGGERGFVTRRDGAPVTAADRAAVRQWLQGCAGVEAVVVGPRVLDTPL